jgi:hypothetical protein
MGKIETQPDQLVAVGGQHAAVAAALEECAGLVRAAAQGIAEGAGHPGAAAAGEDYGASWGTHLAQAKENVHRSGANLSAAAEAYRETDGGQMRS